MNEQNIKGAVHPGNWLLKSGAKSKVLSLDLNTAWAAEIHSKRIHSSSA